MHPLYVDFYAYFNGNQDYFECHEVLEEYWKEVAPGDKDHVLVGLVQLATGMYHWRRSNFRGAAKILTKAVHNITRNEQSVFLKPLNLPLLEKQISHALSQVEQHKSFHSFKIDLVDFELKRLVDKRILEQPKIDDHFLLHKHRLRDRTEILKARAAKMELTQDNSREN